MLTAILSQLTTSVLARLELWRQRCALRVTLAQMSDRQRADIGFAADLAEDEIRRGFWQAAQGEPADSLAQIEQGRRQGRARPGEVGAPTVACTVSRVLPERF